MEELKVIMDTLAVMGEGSIKAFHAYLMYKLIMAFSTMAWGYVVLKLIIKAIRDICED